MGRRRRRGKGEKWIRHYCSSHKILLVGEGDFSFAACLARAFGSASNMVATSLDSRASLLSKYTKAETYLEELEDLDCTVLYGVNARIMSEHPPLRHNSFDRIVFNFPHTGFLEPEYEIRQINRHQKLVRSFMQNAMEMLNENGEIHVTHKTSHPFDQWEIKRLAEEAGLYLVEEVSFDRSDYPGYINKRGDGPKCNKTFPVGEASTFIFAKP